MAAPRAPGPAPALPVAPAPSASAAPRQPRRGPAPFASFDHDVSDESSPESKQTFQLPEIREQSALGSPVSAGGGAVGPAGAVGAAWEAVEAGALRARSQSTPGGALQPAPRIDISRASSSSHHDSRDSSPEMALFGGAPGDARDHLELAFREDGALDLRSSTEELAFLESVPAAPTSAPTPAAAPVVSACPPAVPAPVSAPGPGRRSSRRDSQGSEAALLGVSGRTSRLSSVGSQCSALSAHSALSGGRSSRLSVVSAASRSPSPHKMLLETSFCGPKPIETDPEICAAVVEERLRRLAEMDPSARLAAEPSLGPTVAPSLIPTAAPVPANTRDRREVCTEVTVEVRTAQCAPVLATAATTPTTTPVTAPAPPGPAAAAAAPPTEEKLLKEKQNATRAEERKARPRERRDRSVPKTPRSEPRSKDVIRIKLKPDEEYEDGDEDESDCAQSGGETARKPASLDLGSGGPWCGGSESGAAGGAATSPSLSRRRTPSPGGAPVSRKSSFCSLFKSRETIASPDSPSGALRRKKSLNEGRSRSKSRDRTATPTSATKLKGSVLSLFKTPRKSVTSPSSGSRDTSPALQPPRPSVTQPVERSAHGERLKYYEESNVIHIPLRTPPDERPSEARGVPAGEETARLEVTRSGNSRSNAEPIAPATPPTLPTRAPEGTKLVQRTVLPDGSIIIPLHSPTERTRSEEPFVSRVEVEPPPRTTRGRSTVHSVEEKGASDGPESSPDERRVAAEKPAVESPPEGGTSVEDTLTGTGGAPAGRRKEHIVFTTHVGSREQVFSTQFSITKTPSVTSEISGSFPSFHESEEPRPALRDTHITSAGEGRGGEAVGSGVGDGAASPTTSPLGALRDSSESEPSSEAAPPRAGNDVERRGLVVQDSFEEELPYVPTTLPQERSLAVPMVPVRERGGVHVQPVRRPRAPAPPPRTPAAPSPAPGLPSPPPALPAPPPADKLRIRLPRRARTASGPPAPPAPRERPERARTKSGGEAAGEPRSKREWIDFEEVPERRKQPKRIQTLPAGGGGDGGGEGGGGGVVFSYVEPEQCRCECHAAAPAASPRDDELPLLQPAARLSSPSPEGEGGAAGAGGAGGAEEARLRLRVEIARPFTADFDLRALSADKEPFAEPSPRQ